MQTSRHFTHLQIQAPGVITPSFLKFLILLTPMDSAHSIIFVCFFLKEVTSGTRGYMVVRIYSCLGTRKRSGNGPAAPEIAGKKPRTLILFVARPYASWTTSTGGISSRE